jgi:DNA-binding SARP family transcriptional activator
MWLGVLGPLSVRGDEAEVTVSAARQRTLLAALLVRANHPVSFGELTEVLWDGAPPAGAHSTVRSYVMRLRQALGAEIGQRLVTRDPGYVIEVAEDELDLLQFDGLVRRGAVAARGGAWPEAAQALTEALRLWRGAPLADIASQVLHRGVVPRLEQLRLEAALWRNEAALNLGQHGDLVPELQALVAQHPLQERFHAQLMLALYRSGRAAEALAAYHEARRILADELGVEPGPELQDVFERMLRGDPALIAVERAADRVVPRQLPAAAPYLAGRQAELEALTGLLDQAAGPAPAAAISAVGGTAGIGKTALAVHWARQVAGRFPDGQLYVNLRGFDPSGEQLTPEAAIRDFLAALGVEPRQVPVSATAQAALYRSLLASRRMLVVLDNARDAAQVRPLLPGSPSCFTLVTSRGQLAGLAAVEGARLLALDVLPDEDRAHRRPGSAALGRCGPPGRRPEGPGVRLHPAGRLRSGPRPPARLPAPVPPDR